MIALVDSLDANPDCGYMPALSLEQLASTGDGTLLKSGSLEAINALDVKAVTNTQ